MAQPPVPVPTFPNVPQSPGVPAVFRADNQAPVLNAVLLVADAVEIYQMFAPPQWGVFDLDGQPVFTADSVISVDFRQEYRLADYVMEQGAFNTYDKVTIPYDVRVRFALSGVGLFNSPFFGGGVSIGGISVGGSLGQRTLQLLTLKQAAGTLDLYTVRTPEEDLPSVNIIHVDYHRAREGGVNLIMADVWFRQIRNNAITTTTPTVQPEGASDTQAGTVQASDTPAPTVGSEGSSVGAVTSTPLPAPTTPSVTIEDIQVQ